ncbi:cysteinyl-tRNA synthetase [Rhodotorula sphaerocarpa]
MASTQSQQGNGPAKAPRVAQAPWQVPVPVKPEPRLAVYNSLTRNKATLHKQDVFVTKVPGVVSWYNCGPTVYDASHMGHARNYMAQDIMRRILRDYFGFEVNFVMNITDVDDKIIMRARQSHLLDRYTSENASSASASKVVNDVSTAWTAYVHKYISKTPSDQADESNFAAAEAAWQGIEAQARDGPWLEAQKLADEKFSMHFAAVAAGYAALRPVREKAAAGSVAPEEATQVINANRDALGLWLDKQFGAGITDPAVFRDLAAYWEDAFFKSMHALHIERPTTLTRVSEYLPEIVSFVEGIVQRGYAYEGGGSVWFDTVKFEGAKGEGEGDAEWQHTYAKLQPWSKGNRELLEDGEGSLTSTTGKRSAADFALWKSSKPGEPAWDSPWGAGRPGWHIECSVMASDVLGSGMDVHSGGIDLAFPHHDNELAQSEAFHDCRQWVNYFLHTGHLHIEGLKMSKSLKNFITIDEALEKYTARQMRFAFLLQTWNARLDFKESVMQEVRSAESLLNNFFTAVKARASEAIEFATASDGRHHHDAAEKDLLQKLQDAQYAFRVAMCDSFDTPTGMQILLDTVSAANVYLARGRKNVNVATLLAVSEWVTRMLRMFGLGEGPATDSRGEALIGWGQTPTGGADGAATEVDRETLLMPYLRAMSGFRDQVRQLAMRGASAAEFLALSDKLRNEDMVELGVALDDQEDGRAMIKLVSPESLREARDAKAAAAHEKQARKAAAAAAAEQKRLERLEKGRTPPQEMFRPRAGEGEGGKALEYSAWDEQGVPTKDQNGEDLPKSRVKKLKKEWDVQQKLHLEFLKEQEQKQ